LQLASAFADTDLVEYLTGSPFIDEITSGGWRLDADGMLAIPSKPGLGLTLDPDAVKIVRADPRVRIVEDHDYVLYDLAALHAAARTGR